MIQVNGTSVIFVEKNSKASLIDPKLKCEHCDKFFVTEKGKLAHIRHLHAKDRTWKCVLCGDTFGYAASLKKHVRNYHSYIKIEK